MDMLIGKINHYYSRIGVAVLELEEELKVGDMILILGHTTDFRQQVESLEIDHRKVDIARPGEDVALAVWDYVRNGDLVYRVVQGTQNLPERESNSSAS